MLLARINIKSKWNFFSMMNVSVKVLIHLGYLILLYAIMNLCLIQRANKQ